MVNRVEVTLDIIVSDAKEQEETRAFMHRHRVRRWHHRAHKIIIGRGGEKDARGKRKFEQVEDIDLAETRYDSPRRAPNGMIDDKEDYCRITGDLNCLHIEWRLNNLRAVQSAGIRSGKELLKFNHYQFWKKRMLLVYIDPERLGRLIRNRVNGTKSRTAVIGKVGNRMVNLDRKSGGVILRAYGTMQELLDQCGAPLRLRRILRIIPNDAFLPLDMNGRSRVVYNKRGVRLRRV